ncbi:MAG: response regulator transcription factor [Dehalococcoidia bacterium]|jgi:two-component system competent response regulator ComA
MAVLIVDDHPVVLEGTVKKLAEVHDIEVAGTALTGKECLKKVRQLELSLIILDLNLPDISGMNLIEQILEIKPDLKIIIFTGYELEEYIKPCLDRGASGFILKTSSFDEMITALHVVGGGGIYLDSSLSRSFYNVINGNHHPGRKKRNGANILTAREADILKLIAKGMRNQEIAAALHMSERTVQFHITNMFAKLGVRSRIEALIRSKALGLLTDKLG